MHLTSQTKETTFTKDKHSLPTLTCTLRSLLLRNQQAYEVHTPPLMNGFVARVRAFPTEWTFSIQACLCGGSRYKSAHGRGVCGILLYTPCMTHCLIFFALWHCPFQTPLPLHRHSYCAIRQNTVYPSSFVRREVSIPHMWGAMQVLGFCIKVWMERCGGSCDGMRAR
jgi:hypothetical protein